MSKDVPENTVVAGVPAKPLRGLTERDIKSWQNTKDWYVRLAARYLDGETFRPVPDPRKVRAE